MLYKFEIFGRGVGRELENPMGYYRTTQAAKYVDPNAKLYEVWKGFIRDTFQSNFPDFKMPTIMKGRLNKVYVYGWLGRGLHIDDRFTLKTWIWFANDVRPDASNVTKGVADALFDSDKQVLEQTMWYGYDKKNPRVLVEIEFTSTQQKLEI